MARKKSTGVQRENLNRISPTAKNAEQKSVLRNIANHDVSIIHGLAGTGKTYLATMWGLHEFFKGNYERIIFTRPCVEAHEHLGYLPGDVNEKLAPYMIPIMDFMSKTMSNSSIEQLMEDRKVITLPLAFMRGNTFDNAFVLLDEAQNTIPSQIRMFLTRMGPDSKVVITGDSHQSDIPGRNGLEDAIIRFEECSGISINELSEKSIVRHSLIAEIERLYRKDLDDSSSMPEM
jgi:phosphate starvation-inducible PhoH-like protein